MQWGAEADPIGVIDADVSVADTLTAAPAVVEEPTTVELPDTQAPAPAVAKEPTTVKLPEKRKTTPAGEKDQEGLSADDLAALTTTVEPEPPPEAAPEQGAGATGDAAAMIATAMTQLGVPYVYGGTAWGKGLDCSAFVQQVLARHGISIPRVTYQQVDAPNGQKIADISQARPGDLIFGWGDIGMKKNGHVGIYLGNGKVILAPHTGDVVKIQNVTNRISAIRRYT